MASGAVATQIQIQRVLVAFDFSHSSEKALRHAIAITRSYGASFYLAHVTCALGFTLAGPEVSAMAAETDSRDLQQLEKYLHETGVLSGFRHEAIVREGEVWKELERIVEDRHIDLIVSGTHGRTGFSKVALGSVAEDIFQHSTSPVLTVGPCAPDEAPVNAKLWHVLYPTDLSPESAKAAGYAVSIAKRHDARLTIVHVIDRPGRANTDAQEREFEARLREHVEGELPHNWTFRTQAGRIDETILELAEQGRVELIVLGLRSPHSLRHPQGWPHAYKIVAKACCPVLTVRCGNVD